MAPHEAAAAAEVGGLRVKIARSEMLREARTHVFVAGGGDAANVTAAAFATPGGGTAFVIMNARDDARTLVLSDARFGSVQATVQAHSIETWLW